MVAGGGAAMPFQQLLLLLLNVVTVGASSPPPSQCAAVPVARRLSCGGHGVADTAALCAARGCCWANASEPALVAAPTPAPGGCLSGSLSTPSAGVHAASWTQHVAFANPAGFKTVQAEIAGYVHGGQRGGPGPCCGNAFNLSVANVNNIGFTLTVTRWCGAGGCKGRFVGWGQQLLLAWKAGPPSCAFPPVPVGPTPPPPKPPPTCFYSQPGLPPEEIKEVLIVDADHLDEG